ncbi:MAG: Glu-tRNA(Gln) amidotransferase subunit GatE [Candidatus Micrarchaeia archaeon]
MQEKYDYKKLGFKCGLEIHQRLSTKNKLFCRCFANFFDDKNTGRIERRQRAVAGELGKIDKATTFESRKNRFFLYDHFDKSTCMVDIDEEPPHAPNEDAIKSGMNICASFNCKMPDEIIVMRKGVVDGSDPSAFQRTMMIGYEGSIKVNEKNIPITSIFLEEESGGIIKNTEEYVEYSLDRLGIPLVEIDTDPVITTPEEAKKVSMEIGLILRLTGTSQRGIGSIRQDVNISINNGARIEIKGFQDLDSMDSIIDAEIGRQLKLLEIKNSLNEKNAKVEDAEIVTEIFRNTSSPLIKNQLKENGIVIAAKLKGFNNMLGIELANDLRLGTEISDYAKSSGIKGIIHSDEDMEKYNISDKEVGMLKEKLYVEKDDAFILIAEKEEKAKYGMKLALERARIAMEEVPSETRGADSKKLNTRFLRPMPGKSRMYPETDVLPIDINTLTEKFKPEKVDTEKTKKTLIEEIKNKQLADQMLWSKDLQLYRNIIKKVEVEPLLVASILLEKTKELRRNGIDIEKVNEDSITRIFELYANKKITKAAIGEILSLLPKEPIEVDKIIKERSLERIQGKELEKLINNYKTTDKKLLLKEIMTKYRLNIDGEEINSYIK